MAHFTTRDLADFEDFALFSACVEYGGISAAAKALDIPKSRISRHVTALEARHGVHLIHRTSRRFTVTDLGLALQQHFGPMLDQLHTARSTLQDARREPHGLLRISASSHLANSWLAPLMPRFMERYPKIDINLEAHNRDIDLINNRIDLAIRIRPTPLEDSELIIRHLGSSLNILVAAPAVAAACATLGHPDQLSTLACLGIPDKAGYANWRLARADGEKTVLRFVPRLATLEMPMLRAAASDGLGVALLPAHFCSEMLNAGALQRILPDWSGPINDIHAAYVSRRGLTPAARAFLDFLVEKLPKGDSV